MHKVYVLLVISQQKNVFHAILFLQAMKKENNIRKIQNEDAKGYTVRFMRVTPRHHMYNAPQHATGNTEPTIQMIDAAC